MHLRRLLPLLSVLCVSSLTLTSPRAIILKLTGPEHALKLEDLKVTVTLTNTADNAIKLLDDPRGPLACSKTFPTDIFSITSSNGNHPVFTGAKIKYNPKIASARQAFRTLLANQSIVVQCPLYDAYNFPPTSGDNFYHIVIRNTLYAVDDLGQVTEIRTPLTNPHKIKTHGNLVDTRSGLTIESRSKYQGCSISQQATISVAASVAQLLSSSTVSYLKNLSSLIALEPNSRYSTWFGVESVDSYHTIMSHFTAISDTVFPEFSFDCTCTDVGTFAYVYPDSYGKMYFCGAFWDAPLIGTDSQAGTIIHESSHFSINGGTDDIAYGEDSCKKVAITSPEIAVQNADSHEYFAENNPFSL